MSKKIEGFAPTKFSDAGTGEHFAAGKIHSFDEGQFLNYENAGLVRKPTTEDRKAAQGDSAPAAKPAA
jgi:hypothetical protein